LLYATKSFTGDIFVERSVKLTEWCLDFFVELLENCFRSLSLVKKYPESNIKKNELVLFQRKMIVIVFQKEQTSKKTILQFDQTPLIILFSISFLPPSAVLGNI